MFRYLFFTLRRLLLLKHDLILGDDLRFLFERLILVVLHRLLIFIPLLLQGVFQIDSLLIDFIFICFASGAFGLSAGSCGATTANLVILIYRTQYDVGVTSEFWTSIDPFLNLYILIGEFFNFLFDGILHKMFRTFLILLHGRLLCRSLDRI